MRETGRAARDEPLESGGLHGEPHLLPLPTPMRLLDANWAEAHLVHAFAPDETRRVQIECIARDVVLSTRVRHPEERASRPDAQSVSQVQDEERTSAP